MKLYQLAEIYVQLDLLKQGFEVFTPIHDHSPIDLIAVRKHEIIKIQIKNSTHLKGSRIRFRLKNEDGKYDNCNYFALVEPILNKIWYVPINEKTQKSSINININEIKELPARNDHTSTPSTNNE